MKEQRGYVRLDVRAEALYKIKGTPADPDTSDLEDVGCKGIRIICNKKLKETDILELTLRIPGVNGDINVDGKSVWQREVAIDLYDTGIQFISLEAENKEKLYNFIEDTTGRTAERREYVRGLCESIIEYSRLDQSNDKKNGISVDVCVFGLKAMLREQLDKGTQLNVRFTLPGQSMAIVAKCTVVAWVKQGQENLFETGIEFLEISKEDKNMIAEYVKNVHNSEQ